MYKKHLILGIAIGIFLSSIVFFCAYYSTKDKGIVENITSEVDDDYVVERATELGMIFFDKLRFQNAPETIEENGTVTVSPEEYIYVSVPKNATAIEVAEILEDAGLVEDKIDFTNYLIEANLTKNLQFGEFLIPTTATDDEIASVMTKQSVN